MHRAVTDAVGEALLDWLPAAEHAASVRDAASSIVEVADGGRTVGVGLVVEGRPTLSGGDVVVACAGEPRAAGLLAAAIAPRAVSEGRLEISGPTGIARPVAVTVAEKIGAALEVVMEQRLMVAGSVEEPVDVVGRGRRLREGDRLVVARWLDDFAVEALGAEAHGAHHWLGRLDDPAWQLWLWEVDGTPVSLVNGRPTTPVSSRIGPVYTPPDQRGKGYAGALTAHVTAALLGGGHERVTLFTDQTNPTSNALYSRVGFVDVGAHGSWLVTVAASDDCESTD